MKKLLIVFIITTLSISFAYATLKQAQSIMVDVTLNQSMNHEKTFTTKNKISLLQDDDWTAVSSSQSISTITRANQSDLPSIPNQSLALMKIIKADNKHVTLQFLILNQESSRYSVTQPLLTVNYDQKGDIQIHDKRNDIELTVIAKKV